MGLKEDTDRLRELYKGCIMPWGIDLKQLSDVRKLYSNITFGHLGELDLCKYDDVYKEISKTLDDRKIELLNHEASTLLNNQEVRKALQLWRYWGFNGWVGYVQGYGSKEDFYKKIITLYDILQPYESDIISMNNQINAVYELRSNPSNEVYCPHDCQMLMLLNEVCKFYHDAIECIRGDIWEVQPDKDKSKVLPKELDTDEFRQIYEKAVNVGLCTKGYVWLKTDALLAYFAASVSDQLKLGKGEYNEKLKRTWKPFEILFGVSGLCGKNEDYEKKRVLPTGYKDVDRLFEK